MQENREGSKIV